MPSARRVRLLCTVIVAVLLTILLTSRLRQTSNPDASSLNNFYHKTKTAIDRARSGDQTVLRPKAGAKGDQLQPDKDAGTDVEDDDSKLAKEVADRLKAAEQQAKDLANSKSPHKPDAPSNVIGVGSSAEGQGKKTKGEKANFVGPGKADDADAAAAKESPEDREVIAQLDAIFRRSPVIIFSKSYCPYSQRAKGLLLEKYTIEPPPYVVELDSHPLGPQLQARLAALTGRKTVPNIMVNGKSIGGSDDIAELDREKSLVGKVTALGGRRVTMKERFIRDGSAS